LSASADGCRINIRKEIAILGSGKAPPPLRQRARATRAKGFGLVASEVKMLADQTAKATEEIRWQIFELQQVAASAVDAIRNIGNISEVATVIAAAVEEQGAARSENPLRVWSQRPPARLLTLVTSPCIVITVQPVAFLHSLRGEQKNIERLGRRSDVSASDGVNS
jgi:hypothetical protein